MSGREPRGRKRLLHRATWVLSLRRVVHDIAVRRVTAAASRGSHPERRAHRLLGPGHRPPPSPRVLKRRLRPCRQSQDRAPMALCVDGRERPPRMGMPTARARPHHLRSLSVFRVFCRPWPHDACCCHGIRCHLNSTNNIIILLLLYDSYHA